MDDKYLAAEQLKDTFQKVLTYDSQKIDHYRKYIIEKLAEAKVFKHGSKLALVNHFNYITRIRHYLKLRKEVRSGYQVANDAEIFQIIKEFSPPDGDGWWEPGKERFLPDGTLKQEALEEQGETFELVLPENPVEIRYG